MSTPFYPSRLKARRLTAQSVVTTLPQTAPTNLLSNPPSTGSARWHLTEISARSMGLRNDLCTHQSKFPIRAEQQANQSDYSKVRLS